MSNKVVGVVINQREIGYVAEDAIRLLNHFKEFNIPVLGGDVYKFEENKYVPVYDNWSSNRETGEEWEDFVLRSINKAMKYITSYPYNSDIYFVFVCGCFRTL